MEVKKIERNLSDEEKGIIDINPFDFNKNPYSIKKSIIQPSFLEKLERGEIRNKEKSKTFSQLVKERKQKRKRTRP
jgi:hypothetical protein